jgi:hypothetical protein
MGQYNGDQVANNPTVVANYLRTAPTTRLSTRQLQFFQVYLDSGNTLDFNHHAPNSLFSRAVRGIQAQAEVIAIGSPQGDNFMIVVSADTANDGNNSDPLENYENALARTLQQSVAASTGYSTSDVSVSYKTLRGTGFSGAYGGRSETMPNIEGAGAPSYGNEWNDGN